MRALIIEDDARYGAHLESLLSRGGFLVDWETDANEGLEKGFDDAYAIIVLDLMLGPTDGFSLLRRWRKRGVVTPVLVLTASRTDIEDTTASYEWDADYEIKRPGAEFDDLLLAWARSRSARRAGGGGGAGGGAKVTVCGPITIHHELREARLDDASLDLSQTEFNVLVCLVRNTSRWSSVADISRGAFGANCENPSAQVYEYIKRLRQKLGFGAIRNQRGSGYRLAYAPSGEPGSDAADGDAARP